MSESCLYCYKEFSAGEVRVTLRFEADEMCERAGCVQPGARGRCFVHEACLEREHPKLAEMLGAIRAIGRDAWRHV